MMTMHIVAGAGREGPWLRETRAATEYHDGGSPLAGECVLEPGQTAEGTDGFKREGAQRGEEAGRRSRNGCAHEGTNGEKERRGWGRKTRKGKGAHGREAEAREREIGEQRSRSRLAARQRQQPGRTQTARRVSNKVKAKPRRLGCPELFLAYDQAWYDRGPGPKALDVRLRPYPACN